LEMGVGLPLARCIIRPIEDSHVGICVGSAMELDLLGLLIQGFGFVQVSLVILAQMS
jgi:hypothetical protein